MTTVHVLPTGETPENHNLGDCPCNPRRIAIPRDDGTVDLVRLHGPLNDTD